MPRERFWVGEPEPCARCGEQPAHAFRDGRLPGTGHWVTLCGDCCSSWGVRSSDYGGGEGQRYEKQTDGRWLKTKG